ncbi:MAG TPA: type II secretion system protein [Candidatus Bathyarchaeia archaeon]|nr:type II secretion system protein [Candidatus Bathyarchaeia archaeon]
MDNLKNKRDRGFTLVELLIVLSIIAILFSIALVSLRGTRAVARDTQRKTELEEIRSALEVYRADHGSYPTTLQGLNELTSLGYMETITDPLSPTYDYRYESDGITYNLCAYLEAEDPSTSNCIADCGDNSCNYGVTNP